MRIRRSAFTLLELFAAMAIIAILAAFFLPTISISRGKSNKQKCANNLRGIALGLIQYSNENSFFPHMQSLESPNLTTDVAKVYRTLIHLKYVDSPEIYICPDSEDFPIELDDTVINNPKQFQWKSPTASGSNLAPIFAPPDPDIFTDANFLQLSYTYLRRSVKSSSARSDTMIAADKAVKEDFDAADTGTQFFGPVGNHSDGFNIMYGDGHVDYAKTSEEAIMTRMTQRLHMGTVDPTKFSGK
ncbi:MAG: prepilin-type N-terminal cleavage/methylation domain-containing protein [Planctomycetota bacterium]|nr:prepilin-type N-terminal cleavage/methylation domain-containing protein [Planctomycetota bacterium]